jgi:hypothetical protein
MGGMRRLAALLILPLALGAATPFAPIDGLPIATLPPQELPRSGCAAYLFTTGATRVFAAMATHGASAETLTLALNGKTVALARGATQGSTGRGFPASASYAGEGVSASLSMTVADRSDLLQGAAVTDASLTVERAGADGVVVPMAGLVACRT